jgi:hypothetical protein
MQSGPPGPGMPAGARRVTAAMPGQVDRGPIRTQSAVVTPPIATIGVDGMPMPTGGFDAPFDEMVPERRGPAAGRVRTANLVHRPASTGVRVLVGAAVLVLLVLIPGIVVLSSRGDNPAVGQLNALSLPDWGAKNVQDHSSGSRWCLGSCMVTERTWDSDKSVDETAAAYASALRGAGWTSAKTCPKVSDGVQSCWVLDQNELDLTVLTSACALGTPPPSRTTVDQPAGPPAKPPAGCAPTSVHAKVTDQTNVASS